MTSATDSLGSHLLGRRYESDDRDWQLSQFLETAAVDPIDDLLAHIQRSTITSRWVKRWSVLVTERLKAAGPAPVPSSDVVWADSEAPLDQGQTPHCVGFGWAGGWGNTDPVDDRFTNSDGDAIYYECKQYDGEPGQENGSTVRSGAKAMQHRGRLTNYAFAASVDEAIAWIVNHGPVVFGTGWYESMFTPDDSGRVALVGDPIPDAGHCYAGVGWHPGPQLVECANSWGDWGIRGRFLIAKADLEKLFAAQGEACAAVELA